jgi:hypothetical protein
MYLISQYEIVLVDFLHGKALPGGFEPDEINGAVGSIRNQFRNFKVVFHRHLMICVFFFLGISLLFLAWTVFARRAARALQLVQILLKLFANKMIVNLGTLGQEIGKTKIKYYFKNVINLIRTKLSILPEYK